MRLRQPDDDAFNVGENVLFEWFDVRDAKEYVFALYRTDGGIVSLLDSARIAETTLRYETVPLTDSLSWRVRAFNGVGAGAWSRTFRFSRDKDPRSCTVSLLLPSPGALDVSTITSFSWSANQIPDLFRLEITDAAADTVVISTTLADSSYSPAQPLVNGVSYDWRVRCESLAGNGSFAAGQFTTIRYLGEFLEPLGKTRLAGNHPNPFNSRTTIHFELEDASPVELSVFDVNGRRVADLARETREAGTHEVVWDGTFASGAPAPSGLYLYRIVANGYVEIKSMTLLK